MIGKIYNWIKTSIDRKIQENQFELNIFKSIKETQIPDEDDRGWSLLSTTSTGADGSREEKQRFSEAKLKALRECAMQLYYSNPHMKAIIRLFEKYVVGPGFTYSFYAKEGSKAKAIQEYFQKWSLENQRRSLTKEFIRRLIRDGEIFIRVLEAEIQIIDPNYIRDNSPGHDKIPYGIKYDDDGNVEAYIFSIGNTREEIPTEQMIHVKANADSDMPRGIPCLKSAFKRLNDYDIFLDDRIQLNKVRARIVLLRIHKNKSPQQIKDFSQGRRTSANINGGYNERIKSGTIIDQSADMEHKFLTPNVGANDVKEDGRATLLSISAAAGLPEHMVTSDASNANYASTTAAETPANLEFCDWSSLIVEEIMTPLLNKLMAFKFPTIDIVHSIDAALAENNKLYIDIKTPSITPRDHLADAKENEILYSRGVISLNTWRDRAGIDNEQETRRLEEEDNYLGDNAGPEVDDEIDPSETVDPTTLEQGEENE